MKVGIFLTVIGVAGLIPSIGMALDSTLLTTGSDLAIIIVVVATATSLFVWGIKRIRKARAGILNTEIWGH